MLLIRGLLLNKVNYSVKRYQLVRQNVYTLYKLHLQAGRCILPLAFSPGQGTTLSNKSVHSSHDWYWGTSLRKPFVRKRAQIYCLQRNRSSALCWPSTFVEHCSLGKGVAGFDPSLGFLGFTPRIETASWTLREKSSRTSCRVSD